MKPNFSSIILGTVQLGMPYGIGRWKDALMPEKNAFAILDAAWEMGITTLDTSPNYGIAEERIAKYMLQNPNKEFHVISKIKEIDGNNQNVSRCLDAWAKNNPLLKVAELGSLSVLLHKENDIYRDSIVENLERLKKQKYFSCWGISVYSENAARHAALVPQCDIVQLPFSILNQSFNDNGVLKLLEKRQKITHARSIFTKGLLFLDALGLTGISEETSHAINLAKELSYKQNQTLMQFALNFALSFKQIKSGIIGADDPQQLAELSDCCGFISNSLDLNLICKVAKDIPPADVRPELWS